MHRFTYAPTPARFVPGLKPGAIVETSDPDQAEAWRAHPCFSPVPGAETPTEEATPAASKSARRK